ncbi:MULTISPECIES: sensor histidine kinase [Gaetbulibacter]|uniref:histidine kinase n=1 Tax=Gaetbulibacter jejuensis TaxID=584607 RepID=A0ABN1JFT5_9FLAO|nr:ATP-binding protein [Gaetbulibacter sp. NE]
MNSLLKRQIRKYLTEELASDEKIEQFLDAVDRSYTNFDEQFNMQQRAMTISSDELFEANQKLREEAESQKKIIDKLKRVTKTFKGLVDNTSSESETNNDLNELKLVDFIDNQAREILEINKQREKLLKELEHQNQELSDYAHMVSHDLKSPLRSIDTLVSWLIEDNKDKLDAHCNSQLNLVRANVEKMDTLINGILQYSTISKSEVEFYDVDLKNLVNELVSVMHLPGNFKVKVNHLPQIYGDKSRLIQLFQNLIDNAIKYNDKENGFVELGALDKGEHWEFYIKDNGIGIDEQYHDKIFNTFEKLENSVDSTGIGLSIVKKIVEIYGGEIWLTSKLNEGTTFFFTLKKQLDGAA